MSVNVAIKSWDELVSDATASAEPEVSYNFTVDPLLVSCTLQRLIKDSRDNDKIDYLNWSLTEHVDKIATKITDQDRIFAESLTSYYKSKLLMAKLRGDHFTKFKDDLLKYLTHSPNSLTSRYVGMVYKLPYFYDYDMKLIEIFGGEYTDLGKTNYKDRLDVALTFISKADNGQKKSRHYEYWFKDEHGTRILLEVEKYNPIRNLWEHTIQNGKMNITANFEKKRRDNLEFYVAKGWTIGI